jgi:hypothetical protein
MFCPKCGKENPGDNKFCKECGAALINSSLPITPKYRNSPDAFYIGVGVVLLASAYFMPLVPMSGANRITLVEYISRCSNPIGKLLYGCSDAPMQWVLYIVWIVALFFIVLGLFNKTEA